MSSLLSFFFFFNDTATTEIYTLSLHDALPISVLTGSHIDTVPEGGILDGALGVLAGLEALETIRETNAPHRRPLAVAAWSDEEGRYGSLFGSRAFCGQRSEEHTSELQSRLHLVCRLLLEKKKTN